MQHFLNLSETHNRLLSFLVWSQVLHHSYQKSSGSNQTGNIHINVIKTRGKLCDTSAQLESNYQVQYGLGGAIKVNLRRSWEAEIRGMGLSPLSEKTGYYITEVMSAYGT